MYNKNKVNCFFSLLRCEHMSCAESIHFVCQGWVSFQGFSCVADMQLYTSFTSA